MLDYYQRLQPEIQTGTPSTVRRPQWNCGVTGLANQRRTVRFTASDRLLDWQVVVIHILLISNTNRIILFQVYVEILP